MTPVIEVRDLRTWFETDRGTIRAVDGVSLALNRGEVLGLVGESGSGKSITGFSLIGLLDPAGRIQPGSSVRLDGRELVGLPEREMRRVRGRQIAMVFQDPMMTLNPVLRIIDQIGMAIRAHGPATDAQIRARAIEALERVGIREPQRRVDQYPHEFSGGMRQRVAIAIAMLHRPKLIVADEPTTALDVSVQAGILAEMKALVAETGTALIWISHDLATVASIADKIAVMRHGRIVEEGSARAVLSAPQHPYTRALLDALPSRSSPGQPLPSAAGEGRMIASLAAGSPAARAPDPAFVTANGVSRHFAPPQGAMQRLAVRWGLRAPSQPLTAVRSADLTIARGEILGLVGESGSGKSTLGRILCGIDGPNAGTVRVGGQPVRGPAGKLGTRVQMIFQDPFASLDPRRTIFQSVAEGPLAHGLCNRASVRAHVERWLQAVAFDPALAGRYPHQFSGGQRQRVAIARALAMQPDFVICDEPVASLDVSIQAEVINLLMALRRHLGLTMLFISHDMSVVRHLCDRVMVMQHGTIVEHGAAAQIFDAPQHPYTRSLLEAIPRLST